MGDDSTRDSSADRLFAAAMFVAAWVMAVAIVVVLAFLAHVLPAVQR